MRRALAMLVLCLLGVGAAPDAAAASPQPAQQGSAPQVRGYAISGTVVDAVSGAPLSGARVFVSPVWGGFEAREFVVGEDGRFFFPMLPSGKFALTGEARGYRRQAFNEHEGFSSAIVTGPDISSENLVFRLTRGAAISGRVLDEQGDPVANA